MRTVEEPPGAAVSFLSLVALAGRPRFRSLVLSVALTFVAGLVALPLTEAFVVFLVGLTGVDLPLIELLVDRGAVAIASEVLLGLEDDAVGSTIFFCFLFVVVLVASAAAFALRLAGAMISTAFDDCLSKMCGGEIYVIFRSVSQMRVTARKVSR